MELRFNNVNQTNMTMYTYSFLQNATYYSSLVEAQSSADIDNSDDTYTNAYTVED